VGLRAHFTLKVHSLRLRTTMPSAGVSSRKKSAQRSFMPIYRVKTARALLLPPH
jgi:hypothetical protein